MRCPYIRYKIPSWEILEFILLPIFTRDVSFYYVLCLVGIQVFEIQMCCKEVILKDFFLRWYCEMVSKQSLHHMFLFTKFIVEHSEHQITTDQKESTKNRYTLIPEQRLKANIHL